jgi:hypothetical protein
MKKRLLAVLVVFIAAFVFVVPNLFSASKPSVLSKAQAEQAKAIHNKYCTCTESAMTAASERGKKMDACDKEREKALKNEKGKMSKEAFDEYEAIAWGYCPNLDKLKKKGKK